MMLRIAMLLDNPFRPDQRVLREAEALTIAGHQVVIFAWDRDIGVNRRVQETCNGIHIIRIPIKTDQQLGLRQIPRFLVFMWRIFWSVLKGEFDVIHCHDFLTLPIGVFVKVLKKVNLVYDAHEIYWIMEANKYPTIILKFMQYTEIFLLRWVDEFITVGKKRLDYYREFSSIPVNIVGNWYDPNLPNKQLGKELRERIGISIDSFVITYAGMLAPARGSKVLLDAIRQSSGNNHIHWLICGRGIEESLFDQEASKYPNLHFLGWINDLIPVYSASNALIYLMDLDHPYAHYNAPNNLYLSIAWNLPLIGVATGEIGETLKSDETGLLLSKVDGEAVYSAACKLSENREIYNSIVQNIKELQKKYSWKVASQKLLSIYQNF